MKIYSIENSRSSRSMCKNCKYIIEKNELRIGAESASVKSWYHLSCFHCIYDDVDSFLKHSVEDRTYEGILQNTNEFQNISNILQRTRKDTEEFQYIANILQRFKEKNNENKTFNNNALHSQPPMNITTQSGDSDTPTRNCKECNCEFYARQKRLCPCSIKFASRICQREVECILHKSVFFQGAWQNSFKSQPDTEVANRQLHETLTMNRFVDIDIKDVEMGAQLGKGGFCQVRNAFISSSLSISTSNTADSLCDSSTSINSMSNNYCIKFLNENMICDRQKLARGVADLVIEAHFLASLNHPHILKIHGISKGVKLFDPVSTYFTSDQNNLDGTFLLLEKLNDTLSNKIYYSWKKDNDRYNSMMYKAIRDIKRVKRRGLKIEILNIALNLAQAIQHLHQRNICHRDLKPDNIGFDAFGQVKLFDFGLAKELKSYQCHRDGTYNLTGSVGSLHYIAPEVLLNRRYNLSLDVFSFAVLLWEMCALKTPFEGYTEARYMDFVVQRGFRPELDAVKDWPIEIRNILCRSWDGDMNERPQFREIVTILGNIQKRLGKKLNPLEYFKRKKTEEVFLAV